MNKKEKVVDHWWEYFKILFWSVFPPDEERLVSKDVEQPTASVIRKKYQHLFILGKKKNDNYFTLLECFIKEKLETENERRKTIEAKAHTVLGQTSISMSLLLGLFSFSSSQFNYLDSLIKILLSIIFFLVMLNFICSALHAKNVVNPLRTDPNIIIDTFKNKNITKNEILLEKFYVSEWITYNNDVKAAFLLFSLWFLRMSFILIIAGSITLLPVIAFNKSPQEIPNNININHIFYKDSLDKTSVDNNSFNDKGLVKEKPQSKIGKSSEKH